MSTPARDANASGGSPPMTPDRWRAVDAILQAALDREPSRREAFLADACAGDDAMRREVDSLLAAHDRASGDDFLERPAAEALVVPGTPPLGERLASALAGRYAVERELGRGGMATVHLARDLRHGRRVAIKVLREELAAAVGAERFLEEIRVTASLQHPHILPLFDSGSADGVLWYVMPFVEGETLRSRLARDGRLPVAVALQLAREMADALEYAHRHGVVHRDVKPENVLLQGGHALVADFGIALALEHAGGDRLTRTGITLGTPQYMAPEQAGGDGAIDARTDVYALGAVLHEMLAGEPPFAASSQQQTLRRILLEPPTALASRRADVSLFLDRAVQRALAKRPDDRFPSAAAFATALGVAPDGVPSMESRDRPADRVHEDHHGRRVSARAAMYAAVAMLAIGLAGGWALARSPIADRFERPFDDRFEGAPNSAAVFSPPGARVEQPSATTDALSLTVVDRAGRPVRAISADRPWTPRFSPDGRSVAYGAFGARRRTSDIWVMDLAAGTTRRLTDDPDDSNDPQWSADGSWLAYSVRAAGGKDLMMALVDGAEERVLATRTGTQFASDWMRDGGGLLVTEEAGRNKHDILVQPIDGSPPRPFAATAADETAARSSPDGRWIAYTSDESGRPEVYLAARAAPGRHVAVSSGGGVHPVWRGDGKELYYWNNGALVAVRLDVSRRDELPTVGTRTLLFRAPYQVGVNTMYDVSPDGERFVIVQAKQSKSR